MLIFFPVSLHSKNSGSNLFYIYIPRNPQLCPRSYYLHVPLLPALLTLHISFLFQSLGPQLHPKKSSYYVLGNVASIVSCIMFFSFLVYSLFCQSTLLKNSQRNFPGKISLNDLKVFSLSTYFTDILPDLEFYVKPQFSLSPLKALLPHLSPDYCY